MNETYRSVNSNAARQTRGGTNANIWHGIDLGIRHAQANPRIRKNEGQILEKSAKSVSTHPVNIDVRASERNFLLRGPINLFNAANDNSLQRRTKRTEE
jgi:hypothetical protein